jgi:hypothetical protein
MLQSPPPIIRFLANKIQSTEADFEEYLIDVSTIFAEFDGQTYDRDAIVDRFLVLSGRSNESERDPSFYRDKFSSYASYLGILIVVREGNRWVCRLSDAASQLLCGDEPNVRAFSRVQLSLLQYPYIVGTQYTSKSAFINDKALKPIKKLLEAQVKVVPFRLILRALRVKAETSNIHLSNVSLTHKEIFCLFNNTSTNQHPNPSEDEISRVLGLSEDEELSSTTNLQEFQRNFHFLETTGLIKRSEGSLMLDLSNDLESSRSKLEMVNTIASMTSFCEDFYNYGSLSIEAHLKQMAYDAVWSQYYDGSKLPQDVYSRLTGGSPNDQILSTQVASEETDEPFTISSTVTLPPLTPRQAFRSPPRTSSSNESTADPELTQLKRQKSNAYHRLLVRKVEEQLRARGCNEPRDNIYIDLAGELNGIKILFEMKSCNSNNVISQIRKAVSQVYEYRYRYSHEFPQESTLLCIVAQERPDDWWLNYLINDRGINVIWLEGDVNLACSSDCNELIRQLVDIVE